MDLNTESLNLMQSLAPGQGATMPSDYKEEDYHALTGIDASNGEWLTRSLLHCFSESPTGGYLRYVAKHPLAQVTRSNSLDIGSLVDVMLTGDPRAVAVDETGQLNRSHTAQLIKHAQNGTVEEAFAVAPLDYLTPGGAIATRKAKKTEVQGPLEWREEMESAGLICITPSELDAAATVAGFCLGVTDSPLIVSPSQKMLGNLIVEQMHYCPYIAAALKRPMIKQPVYRWIDEETGLPIQVRPDLVIPFGDIDLIADVKTSKEHPREIAKSADKYGYDMQQHLCQEGHRICTGRESRSLFFVGMNGFPFAADAMQLQERQVENAAKRTRLALYMIKNKAWHPTATDAQTAMIPAYIEHRREMEVGA